MPWFSDESGSSSYEVSEEGQVVGIPKGLGETSVARLDRMKGKFLKVWVRIEVDKPLRRCLRVDVIGDREETVMILHYEQFLNHYFRCGRIGHPTMDCSKASESSLVEGGAELPFGPWLRAIKLEKLGGGKEAEGAVVEQ
ncbi:hypothetical protein EZV62_004290 [Acer yangbiense]|uniref:Zinc knuckle CX2CX4HX4C domain-containing protein n=1 Tax=Acer yangbiense TaxID=1000413 RepID=A0A5C7IJP9_9ROSI|nr:hypothetical protein EZV62_004290 [Acer yangbiense]